MPLGRLRLNRTDLIGRVEQRSLETFSLSAVADIEPVDLLAIRTNEARREGGAIRCLQMGDDGPIFPRDEHLDLALTVADQTQGDRLHTAG